MATKQSLRKLIAAFLEVNPKPADAQLRSLARSVGVTLLAGVLTAGTESEDVLDGDYSPDTTTPNDLMLNDGEPAGNTDAQDNQSALYDDGVGPNDFGVDVDNDQSALINDGTSGLKIDAAVRLQLTAAAPDQLAMTKAVHLKRSKYTLAQLAEEEGSCTVYALKLSVPAGDPKYYFAVSFGTGPSNMKIGDKSRFRTARVTIEGVFKITKDGKVSGRGEGKDASRPVYMFK